MQASGISLLDANVWLAIAFSDHVHHAIARTWFDAQLDGTCAFCRLTQMAILRHLTNSKIMGAFVQSQHSAWVAYDALASDARVVYFDEPPHLEAEFRSFSQSSSPSHKRWSDAYLAAVAKQLNARIATFDRGLADYAGVNVVILDPAP